MYTRYLTIIQAPLETLLDLQMQQGGATEFENAYLSILIHHLRADVDGLRAVLEGLPERGTLTPTESVWLQSVGQLRFQILQRNVSEAVRESVNKIVDESRPPLWNGEALFVLAMAAEMQNEHEGAKELYRRAYVALQAVGAEKKAVKALLNFVASESRIHPEKMLMVDYHNVYRKALSVEAKDVAAIAINNIAKEHQTLGAFSVALRYYNDALTLLEQSVGTNNYYLTLANRAHLLFQMGRIPEARVDYGRLLAANHLEAKGALAVLETYFTKRRSRRPHHRTPSSKMLVPSWKERKMKSKRLSVPPGLSGHRGLGKLAEELICFLSAGPKDKAEIIFHLYGDRLELATLENRLNNLLNRLRKQRPGLIVLENGKYALVDAVILDAEDALRKAG